MYLLMKGGWIIAAILAISFAAWFLIILKWLRLRDEMKAGSSWAGSAVKSLGLGDSEAARKLCVTNRGFLATVMLSAMEIWTSGRTYTSKSRKKILDRETAGLHRNLDLIATSGAVLPLLGLLGTVLGMTKTFGSFATHLQTHADSLMAGGVSQALITTQAGLFAALPIVLMHGVLSSYIRRNVEEAALVMKQMDSILMRNNENV